MLGSYDSTSVAVAVGVLMLTTSLAGCMAGGESLTYSSYEEAKSAPGAGTFSPNVSDSQLSTLSEDEANDIKIKVLHPTKHEGLEEGEQDVVLLLFNQADDEPITDATIAHEARMPAMGHGTQPEEDPVHKSNGQYVGMTTWSMSGSWILNVDVQLPSGDVLAYDLHMDVGEEHGHGDGHDHSH